MLSVANLYHNENSKNGKQNLLTNAHPLGAALTNPCPQAKAWMRKPQGGGKFLVQVPRGVQGDSYAKN